MPTRAPPPRGCLRRTTTTGRGWFPGRAGPGAPCLHPLPPVRAPARVPLYPRGLLPSPAAAEAPAPRPPQSRPAAGPARCPSPVPGHGGAGAARAASGRAAPHRDPAAGGGGVDRRHGAAGPGAGGGREVPGGWGPALGTGTGALTFHSHPLRRARRRRAAVRLQRLRRELGAGRGAPERTLTWQAMEQMR